MSWEEIKQVFKPAWQAVKILPGSCQFCRKCHTPSSSQAEINRKFFSFPVNIFEISEASLVPTVKFKKENWHELKKNGMGQLKVLFQKHILVIFFQYKPFTDTISSPLNTAILKPDIFRRMSKNNCTLILNVCLHHLAITEHAESCKKWGVSS